MNEKLKKNILDILLFRWLTRLRTTLTRKALLKNVVNELEGEKYYWTFMPFPLIKLLIFYVVVIILYSFYRSAGTLLYEGFVFFKFHEIFKFKLPDKSFFITLTHWVFFFILLYHSVIFSLSQIQSLFSSFIISRQNKAIYYIKNKLYVKTIFTIPFNEIISINVKQGLILKYLKISSLEIKTRHGETILIHSLYKADGIVKEILKQNEITE